MYILLEYITCVVLVAGAVATLMAVGWACVTLVQVLCWAAGRLLPRSSLAALRLGRSLFVGGDNRVAVRISASEAQAGRVPLSVPNRHAQRHDWRNEL